MDNKIMYADFWTATYYVHSPLGMIINYITQRDYHDGYFD